MELETNPAEPVDNIREMILSFGCVTEAGSLLEQQMLQCFYCKEDDHEFFDTSNFKHREDCFYVMIVNELALEKSQQVVIV